MYVSRLQFNFNFWPTLATFLVSPLFAYLGFWQLDRAAQKDVLQDEFRARQVASVVDFNILSNLDKEFSELNWRRVKAQGVFDPNINILLDNQVVNGVAGYFVYTPFKLEAVDVWVLVNRGWVAAGQYRNVVPNVILDEQQLLTIYGNVKAPPRTGIMLAENVAEQLADAVYRIQKLSLNDIESLTQRQFLPYIIRLNPISSSGFLRDWRVSGSGRQIHLGYAFQWFAMAFAVLCIYLLVNVRRVE